MQPGSHYRPGIQSCTPCSWKIHRLEKYEPLTLPKLLPRMPSTDNPRNDQLPGTCTQVVKVTQCPFKFPKCVCMWFFFFFFFLYKHLCSSHPMEQSSILWLSLYSFFHHFVVQKFHKLTNLNLCMQHSRRGGTIITEIRCVAGVWEEENICILRFSTMEFSGLLLIQLSCILIVVIVIWI